MRKKICFVGGEDVHKRIPLSKCLTDLGYKITIIGTSNNKFPDYINYVDYNLVRHFSPTSDYKTIKWFQKFFSENNFDLIHTFDTKPAFLLPIALFKTKTPITRTITGLGTIFMSDSPSSVVFRQIYKILHFRIRNRVFNTVFQNHDDRDIYLSYKLVTENNSPLILSSGIELNNFKQKALRNNSTFTFICVARLVYEKGITNLLEAARNCKEQGYNFKVLLVGPLEENSKKLNENILKNYSDVVTVLGERQDVIDLLLQSNAFVLPTFREGFARVLLEAAAIGLPIISTNVTGVREFIRQNEEGILIEPKNSIALTEAMITIANDDILANKLVENALKRVELFSIENVSKQYITIFEKAINES
jgi:glycosyltransferase involved in cell wall biosynthesis